MNDDLEKRLHNVELMLLALCTAVKEVLPPEYQRLVGERQAEWFEASKELGAFNIPILNRRTIN